MATITIVKCRTCGEAIDFKRYASGAKYYWLGKGKAEHVHCPPNREAK